MCVCVCVCVCVYVNHVKLIQPYKLTILQLKKMLRMTKHPSNGCQAKSLAIITYDYL